MKTYKVLILEKIVRKMALLTLKKYKPKVVAITGSVGKTTAKEAIYTVLSKNLEVRASGQNYNNEIGVPLTIIGREIGNGKIFDWIGIFVFWFFDYFFSRKYPKVLILELGVDRPGDVKYFCDFISIDVGVLTNIGISHLEHFKNQEELAREKSFVLKSVPAEGLSVCNFDNEKCAEMAEKLGSNVITFGFKKGADFLASDFNFHYKKLEEKKDQAMGILDGISFKLNFHGKIIPVKLNHALSYSHIYACLAALAVGEYFRLKVIDSIKALEKFLPPRGRMVCLSGIKNSVIIDDTYNSAPDSANMALQVLSEIKAKRRIAVLGDMLELGKEEIVSHENIGRAVAGWKIDFFVAVGERMKKAVGSFSKIGSTENVFWFDNPMEAGIFVQEILRPEDVVLVKGSQGMRMEKIVEEIMAEPRNKEVLLVRQSQTWQKRPYVKV